VYFKNPHVFLGPAPQEWRFFTPFTPSLHTKKAHSIDKTLIHSLMRLTQPLNIAPTNESTPEIEERLMDVVSVLVPHLQPPVAVDPR
jgi:hypothetical protein